MDDFEARREEVRARLHVGTFDAYTAFARARDAQSQGRHDAAESLARAAAFAGCMEAATFLAEILERQGNVLEGTRLRRQAYTHIKTIGYVVANGDWNDGLAETVQRLRDDEVIFLAGLANWIRGPESGDTKHGPTYYLVTQYGIHWGRQYTGATEHQGRFRTRRTTWTAYQGEFLPRNDLVHAEVHDVTQSVASLWLGDEDYPNGLGFGVCFRSSVTGRYDDPFSSQYRRGSLDGRMPPPDHPARDGEVAQWLTPLDQVYGMCWALNFDVTRSPWRLDFAPSR